MNTQNMTEKEILTDLLNEEKSLIKEYAGNVVESGQPSLRQLLISCMSECSADQYTVFDQMRARNMYPTKQAPTQEVQTAKQDMQTLKQQTGF